jgi:hypothetical protein
MKINTVELRKLIREELQKTAAPMLKQMVKESLIKNAINEVLVNLIAESIVDKQEALALMREQVSFNAIPEDENDIGTIRLTTKDLPDPAQKTALSRLDERQRATFRARYEEMIGGALPIPKSKVPIPGYKEQESKSEQSEASPDIQKVIAMLPETNTEGAPLHIDAIPEHLAVALTKDYRQTLKNIHTSVNNR